MIKTCDLLCDYQIIDCNNLRKLLNLSPLRLMASISSLSQNINIWSLDNLVIYKILKGHSQILFDIDFSPLNRLLFSSSLDNTVKCWNFIKGNCLLTFKVSDYCLIKIKVCYNDKLFLFEGKHNISELYPKLRYIDIFNKEINVLHKTKTEKQIIYDLIALNQKNSRIAYTSGYDIIIFNLELNFIVKTLKNPNSFLINTLIYYNENFNAINPQEELLISGDLGNSIIIWNIFKSNIVKRIQLNENFQKLERILLFPQYNKYHFCIFYLRSGAIFIFNTEKEKIEYKIMEFHDEGSQIFSLFLDEKTNKIYASGKKGKFKVYQLKYH